MQAIATQNREDPRPGDEVLEENMPDKTEYATDAPVGAALIAQAESRWPLAGDQLYVDMDLSEDNLPPGTQVHIGTAIFEITTKPHTGCAKFSARFGPDALAFVNSPEGKRLHLRGIYAKVVQAGVVRAGDAIRKAA